MILNRQTRELWAEKTLELTNIGAGVLLFGQLLSEKGFSLSTALVGLAFVFLGYAISLALLHKK